ncbi:MAG: glutamate decarboxylase [Microbacterium sp.]|jgi:glutamate decarboxylase|nr:glutamate decarboxylase [Microbacterium sp.]
MSEERIDVNPLHRRTGDARSVDKNRIPERSMDPLSAYHIVRDETMLDGNARLNLATFVTTWMDEEAQRLYADAFDKNMIDKDEYPQTAAIEGYCQRMIAELWHAPDPSSAPATSTVGSSEACMLAGIALKRRWQERRRSAGADAGTPNLVMSSAVQVCWEKFCNYFEVEPRYVPVSSEHPVLDGELLDAYVDENTIGVVAILGVTYTGAYEPVAEIQAALDAIEAERGLDVPIHVDAASGGMVAPFLDADLEWDFRLQRVASINTSGHKYGLVYPGLGWAVWRDEAALPESMVFRVSYLGGDMPTLALNFSRPGAQVLLQFYLFLRLGREGYTEVQAGSRAVAAYLAEGIGAMDAFELISDGTTIPVFAWRLADGHSGSWTLHDLSDRLRMRGWLVPAYPMPADLDQIVVQRIVIRNGVTMDLAESLLSTISEEVEFLEALDSPLPRSTTGDGFRH